MNLLVNERLFRIDGGEGVGRGGGGCGGGWRLQDVAR